MTEWCRRLTTVEVICSLYFHFFAYSMDLKSTRILRSTVVSQYDFEKLTKLTYFPFEKGPSFITAANEFLKKKLYALSRFFLRQIIIIIALIQKTRTHAIISDRLL